MKIVDLTHKLNSEITVYPGTEKPIFRQSHTVEKDGFAEQKITLYTHTGTHIDAPSHMLSDGVSLDKMPLDKFTGKAICIDCTDNSGENIDIVKIIPYSKLINELDFVLFRTGWSEKWKTEEYFNNFPVLSKDACKWLCSFNLKGIGFDTISIDSIDGPLGMSNHHTVLKSNMIIVENLTNLDQLDNSIFMFSCFPLKIQNADGSPVRAIATYNIDS